MDARLLELLGPSNARIAYIPSASHPEQLYYRRKRDYYARHAADLAICIEPDEELSAASRRALLSCDAVHLSGGNTFVFADWLRRRGVLSVLRTFASDGGVLVGESAGAILMTPDVRSAILCGDAAPAEVGEVAALGLVPFHFWPHYVGGESSGHPEVLGDLPCVYGCPDGSGVVVDRDRVEIFGGVTTFRWGVSAEA